jgi:hypothetical protein
MLLAATTAGLLLVIGVSRPFKFWVGGEHMVGIVRGKDEEEEKQL